jgi:hypothetical protein
MTQAAGDKSAATPGREQLYFDPIKEHRGAYFVEYQPPVADAAFATYGARRAEPAVNHELALPRRPRRPSLS